MDNLPCATKLQLPDSDEIFYDHGFKLGYVGSDGKVAFIDLECLTIADDVKIFQVYVNNHIQMNLKYHEHSENNYRVVGFEVEPRSVKWDALKYDGKQCSPKAGEWSSLPPQEITKGQFRSSMNYFTVKIRV